MTARKRAAAVTTPVQLWQYDPEGGSVLSGAGKPTSKSKHEVIAWVHSGHADGYTLAAAPAMRDALHAMLAAFEALLPGIKHISVPDYSLINMAPILAKAALNKASGQP